MSIDGVKINPLEIIDIKGGDVFHGMKQSDNGYSGFGEVYFSNIKSKAIKGWKRHKRMVMNLIVPVGSVRFILYDDHNYNGQFQEVVLSVESNYSRLTIPPMVWVGFQGLSKKTSLIMNLANIEHSDKEVDRIDLTEIEFDWSKFR